MTILLLFTIMFTGCLLENSVDNVIKMEINENLLVELNRIKTLEIEEVERSLDNEELSYSEAMQRAVEVNNDQTMDLLLRKKGSLGDMNLDGLFDFVLMDRQRIVDLMGKENMDLYNYILEFASYKGDIVLVQEMLNRGAKNYNDAMNLASVEGHMEILNFMIDKGANDYNGAIKLAAVGGQKGVVESILEKVDNNYGGEFFSEDNSVLINIDYSVVIGNALIYCHREIVDLMFAKGFKLINDEVSTALSNNDKEMVESLLTKDEFEGHLLIAQAIIEDKFEIINLAMEKKLEVLYGTAMAAAIYKNNREIIDLIFEKKLGFYDKGLIDIILERPQEMVSLIIRKNGVDLYNGMVLFAVLAETTEILEQLFERGANNYRKAIICAINADKKEVLKLLLGGGNAKMSEDGVNHCDFAIVTAIAKNQTEIVELIIEKGIECGPWIEIAIIEDNKDIIELVLKKYEKDHFYILALAIKKGNVDIVNLVLEKQRIGYDEAMYNALKLGNEEMINFIFEKKAGTHDKAILDFMLRDSNALIELMREHEREDVNYFIMYCAFYNGNRNIADQMLGILNEEKGDNWPFLEATCRGHIELLEYVMEKNLDYDYERSMAYAAEAGHLKIIKLMLERVVNFNYNYALVVAAQEGHMEVVNFF